MKMHQNSINTYYEEIDNLSDRQKKILEFFKENPDACYTDREVQMYLGYRERNQVQPRISELIKINKLWEVGKRQCKITGKTVRLVSIAK